MSRVETLIVQNPRAGNSKNYALAHELEQNIPKAEVRSLSELEKGEVLEIPEKVVLVGGDGTFHYVIEWFNQHDEKPLIFLAGGGTGNILRKTLKKEKATVSVDELVKEGEELAKKTIHYKPGVIKRSLNQQGSDGIFTLSLGLGAFEKYWVEAMEKIRPHHKLGALGKLYGAGLCTLPQTCNGNTDNKTALRNYSLGPFIGPFQVFKSSEVSLKNDNIGFIEVSDQNPTKAVVKLMITLFLWQCGHSNVPFSLATKGYGTEWYEEAQGVKTVNVDGNLKNLPEGNLTIKKNGTIFSVAALSVK